MTNNETISTEQAIDRLSSLPEPIIDHILSFLPMEDVVRTSILSRQWRCICYSLSQLKFDQCEFKEAKGKSRESLDFVNFVDIFLINHDRSEISSFELKISDASNGEVITDGHVNAWVSFAIKHKVRMLKLDSFNVLPLCLFTCNTLTVLTLKHLDIHFPSMVSFPSLKRLKIIHATLFGEHLTESIFSSCPVLEGLTLKYCDWYDFFNTNTTSGDIHICSPNLQVIRYYGPQPPNISSETLSSLVSVDLELDEEPYGNSVTKLLTGLHNVAKLSLDDYCFEFLCKVPDLAACLPTSCCSLTHLRLVMRPDKDSLKVLILLLRSYPNLETLHISLNKTKPNLKSILISSEQSKMLCDAYFLEHFTGHLLKHLKTINIENFRVSYEEELHIVRYLLENAISLKKMSIVHHRSVKKNVNYRLLVAESLLTFTKVSPDAVIVFS